MIVSVVIPTFERRASVERLLRGLRSQTLPADRFEVVVSIDGSTDGTREAVASFDAAFEVRGIWNEHRGRASACNAGIRAAHGELVVLLDDDMMPAPSCLEEHVEAHASTPDARRIVFGAAPVTTDDTSSSLTRYMARKFARHLNRLERPEHVMNVRDFYSGNMSARRDVMLSVGLFDESFREYGNEDLELAVRCRRAGIEVTYSPDAGAEQRYEKPFRRLARDTVAKGRTAVAFAAKHPEVAPALQLSQGDLGSRRWRLARDLLLAVTRAAPFVPEIVARLGALIDRLPVRDADTVYRFLLEYFYWVGVRAAVRERDARRGRITERTAA